MEFSQLNLPNIVLKTKLVHGTIQVFDVVRKKYFKWDPVNYFARNAILKFSREMLAIWQKLKVRSYLIGCLGSIGIAGYLYFCRHSFIKTSREPPQNQVERGYLF